MKNIPISRGYVAIVDDDDYENLSSSEWTACVQKNRAGSVSIVYAYRWTSAKDGPKRMIYMHRQVAGASDPKVKVDHKDHDGLNNTRGNIRIGTSTQNLGNQRIRTDNTSGYKGVTWYEPLKKWRAKIQFCGKHISIGYFNSIEQAALAYESKAKELFGEFYCTENVTTRRNTA